VPGPGRPVCFHGIVTVELGTLSWGAGGRRLLLLHGLSSNAAGWWRVGPDVAAAGWAVTAADLRGHGTSAAGDDYSFAAYAADLLALGGGWDAVVGHSLGAAAALTAHSLDPAWTAGMVLQDPALLMAGADADRLLAALLADLEGPATVEELAAGRPGWSETDVRIKAEALQQTGSAAVRGTIGDNRPWDLRTPIEAVAVPTVILASDPGAGGIVPPGLGERLAAANRLIRFVVLPGAGHSAHREEAGYPRYRAALLEALQWIVEEAG
jgi:pimeloyl-ACP methyl ester carboxylesterase